MKNKNKQEESTSSSLKMKSITDHDRQINAVLTDKELPSIHHEKTVRMLKKVEQRPEYPENSSYISLSNISLRDVVLKEEELDENYLQYQFDHEQMRQTFEQYQILADQQGVDLLPETLEKMAEILKLLTIKNNDIAEAIYNTILLLDGTFPHRFIGYSRINNPNSGFLTNVKSKTRDHLIRHFKKIIEFHRICVNALINNREEAAHFIHLFGLSHFLMKIPFVDMNELTLVIINVLLQLNICDEDTVMHVVGYLCTVIQSVGRTMAEYTRNQQKLIMTTKLRTRLEDSHSTSTFELTDQNSIDKNLTTILNSGGTVNLSARQNYREMKDWHQLREEILRNVDTRNSLVEEIYQDRPCMEIFATNNGLSSLRLQSSGSDSAIKLEEKRFLTWLKKGYKFKTDETSDIYYN